MKNFLQLVLGTWQKYIYSYLKNAWSKYNWYIAPFVVLVTSIVISLCILNKDPDKITLSLSILGSGFAVFQFWVTEINTNRRKKYELRFQAYKELFSLSEYISEIILERQLSIENNNYQVERIVAALIIQQCRLNMNIRMNDPILFPGLLENPTTTKLYDSIQKITDIISNEKDALQVIMSNIDRKTTNKKTSTEILKIFEELINSQPKFYSLLRTYLINI